MRIGKRQRAILERYAEYARRGMKVTIVPDYHKHLFSWQGGYCIMLSAFQGDGKVIKDYFGEYRKAQVEKRASEFRAEFERMITEAD